jgi:hypothetical protein
MKTIPVYFPMTYLSAAAEGRLAACFGQTAVYRPSVRTLPETMQAAVDAKRLVVHTPVKAESDRLAALMKAYYAWAEENKGVDLSVIKGRESRIPFYEDTSISRIRQNIRNMGTEKEKEEARDPVFRARLFLEMAQELDRQNSELERSLDHVRVKEDSMLSDLLGDSGGPGGIETVLRADRVADPGAYMTGTRLQAWWQLARTGPGTGNLLVTDSRSVIETLVEKEPGLKKAGPPLKLPFRQSGDQAPAAWQGRLSDYLAELTSRAEAGDVPADLPVVRAGDAAVSLSFYRLEETDTETLFNSLSAPGDALSAPGPETNLVICLVADEGPIT